MNKIAKKRNQADSEMSWPFGKTNYIYLGISVVVMIIGFYLLSIGSMTLAPILLIIGYCVLVPIAIMKRDKTTDTDPIESD